MDKAPAQPVTAFGEHALSAARMCGRAIRWPAGMGHAWIWVVATVIAPCALGAQASPGQVDQDWLVVYQGARQAYYTALAERNALRSSREELIDQRNLAIARRDNERADQLLAEYQQKAEELDRADAELRRLEEEWVEAGEVLIGWVDANREIVTQQLEGWPTGAEDDDRFRQLEARFDSLTSLRDSVDAEIPRVPLEVPPMPNVQRRPGDGQAELRRKATIYEDYADVCQRRIDKVGERMDELTRARDIEDAKAGFDRGLAAFGGRVPVGLPGGGLERPTGDTTVTDLRTLSQRIEDLEELQRDLEAARDEALVRASALLGGAGGSE